MSQDTEEHLETGAEGLRNVGRSHSENQRTDSRSLEREGNLKPIIKIQSSLLTDSWLKDRLERGKIQEFVLWLVGTGSLFCLKKKNGQEAEGTLKDKFQHWVN